MANIYVKSGASNTSPYDTWAKAATSLATAAGIDANGDTIFVSQSHAESSSGAQTISFAGTVASPVRIICGNDGAEPPTSAATTGTITTTSSAGAISLSGVAYLYGLTFNCGTGTSSVSLTIAATDGNNVAFESCNLKLLNTGSGSRIVLGGTNSSTRSAVKFVNCGFYFLAAGQGFTLNFTSCEILGGSILSGSTTPTALFNIPLVFTKCLVRDFDFSNLSSSANLVTATVAASGVVQFVNCKLPASWSGNLVTTVPANIGFRASMYNCDSGTQNYRLWIETYAGNIKSETTLVKTGGASNGTTALSWKLATTAYANETVTPLITDDMAIWIDSTGTSKTITVDILHDSATALTDAEVWLEIDYLGSNAQPLGTPASDKRATVLTTAANQTTSSATWTTTGMTNPNRQKLEVTFTPNMKGFVYARVCLAKASYTIYVDPEPVIS